MEIYKYRGGAYNYDKWYSRSVFFMLNNPYFTEIHLGFRLTRRIND